jgi:hypothetical protein
MRVPVLVLRARIYIYYFAPRDFATRGHVTTELGFVVTSQTLVPYPTEIVLLMLLLLVLLLLLLLLLLFLLLVVALIAGLGGGVNPE